MRRLTPALLAAAGLALMLLAWAVANPLGAVSDEPDYYIKAVGAGYGDITGTKVTPQQAAEMDYWLPQLQQTLLTYPADIIGARAYRVPAALDPVPIGCTVQTPGDPARCLYGPTGPSTGPGRTFVSSVGSYQPFTYVPAGLLMRFAWNRNSAVVLGRLAFVAMELALLWGALAVAFSIRRRRTVVLGTLLAVTPTALLCLGSLQSSGPEIAAGIAFWTGLLAASETGAAERRGPWVLLAFAGLVLGCARTSGPVYVVLEAAIVLLLFRGVRPSWAALRGGGRWAALAVLGTIAGCLAGAVWQVTQQPHLTVAATTLPFEKNWADLQWVIARAVGVYGWGESMPPGPALWAWGATVAALVALALVRGARRWRAVATVLATVVVGIGFVFLILVYGRQLAGIQGRWFVPLLAGIPVVAGWVAAEPGGSRLAALATRWLPAAGLLVVAAGMGVSWWVNARNYAVGTSGRFFFPLQSQDWRPPLGWWPWIAVVLAGALCIVAAGLLPERDEAAVPASAA